MDEQTASAHEFASWQSYNRFARSVRGSRRFIWSEETRAFLATVRETLQARRVVEIASGKVLHRAQRGTDTRLTKDTEGRIDGVEILGYSAARMKPQTDRASEGRANPSGIPVLYLASTVQTAISEVRAWIGADVSVAEFQVSRTLRALDLTLGHGHSSWEGLSLNQLYGAEPTPEERERAVWTDIDNAFSRPVTLSDNEADYVPTQILAEIFRDAGFDAIIYRSQFGEDGRNYVLFDVNDAEVVNCAPFQVKSIEISADEIGNRWYRTAVRAEASSSET